MGVYYDFYLEKLVEKDKWSSIQYGDSGELYRIESATQSLLKETKSQTLIS